MYITRKTRNTVFMSMVVGFGIILSGEMLFSNDGFLQVMDKYNFVSDKINSGIAPTINPYLNYLDFGKGGGLKKPHLIIGTVKDVAKESEYKKNGIASPIKIICDAGRSSQNGGEADCIFYLNEENSNILKEHGNKINVLLHNDANLRIIFDNKNPEKALNVGDINKEDHGDNSDYIINKLDDDIYYITPKFSRDRKEIYLSLNKVKKHVGIFSQLTLILTTELLTVGLGGMGLWALIIDLDKHNRLNNLIKNIWSTVKKRDENIERQKYQKVLNYLLSNKTIKEKSLFLQKYNNRLDLPSMINLLFEFIPRDQIDIEDLIFSEIKKYGGSEHLLLYFSHKNKDNKTPSEIIELKENIIENIGALVKASMKETKESEENDNTTNKLILIMDKINKYFGFSPDKIIADFLSCDNHFSEVFAFLSKIEKNKDSYKINTYINDWIDISVHKYSFFYIDIASKDIMLSDEKQRFINSIKKIAQAMSDEQYSVLQTSCNEWLKEHNNKEKKFIIKSILTVAEMAREEAMLVKSMNNPQIKNQINKI